MTLYLVLLLYIPLLLIAICPEKDDKVLKGLFLLLFLIFIFYHLDAGPDHLIYEWAYNEPPFSLPFEPLFSSLIAVSKSFGLDYIGFLIFFRCFSFLIFAYAIFNIDKYKFIFFMGLYIPISFITFELNLLRQSLSLHLGLSAVCAYMNANNKKSYIFMVLAIMSHLSAIMMVLIYLNRVRVKVLLLLAGFATVVFTFILPAILSKVDDYQELGALNVRMDIAALQTIMLMILPFVFFKLKDDFLPKLFYITLCLMTFIPVLVRLYPIALLVLLPSIVTTKGNKFITTLLLFIYISIFMAIGKTYLLLQADLHAIQEGIYQHGYTK
ncbi:EpsG family protein [Shewanella algae]|uniref:EpsG family protein n=1 Tax=Shewanella algae TaxID=38313 RepID=UPI00192D6BCF|nr:EpsG family protein [Shewanella algae]MCE9777540.1 EpsG family protein [Shewanella algae]